MSKITLNPPTLDQRISVCSKPISRHHIMYQKWRDLLFLHWEYSPEVIQQTLPKGLSVDTYDGKAFLGVVPFYMQGIRPRFCPAVPGISNFLEINLRTYVYDEKGRPGVWFYSLDANQWLAVQAAQKVFNLPYFEAKIEAEKKQTNNKSAIDYKVSRKNLSCDFDTHLKYAGKDELEIPKPESLEFFLVERYLLFAADKSGSVYCGQVHHSPYSLKTVEYEIIQQGLIAAAGFDPVEGPPNHAIMSPGVDVKIYALEKLN